MSDEDCFKDLRLEDRNNNDRIIKLEVKFDNIINHLNRIEQLLTPVINDVSVLKVTNIKKDNFMIGAGKALSASFAMIMFLSGIGVIDAKIPTQPPSELVVKVSPNTKFNYTPSSK
jgi:hypothetical protein